MSPGTKRLLLRPDDGRELGGRSSVGVLVEVMSESAVRGLPQWAQKGADCEACDPQDGQVVGKTNSDRRQDSTGGQGET
jgi:hypothetical protein